MKELGCLRQEICCQRVSRSVRGRRRTMHKDIKGLSAKSTLALLWLVRQDGVSTVHLHILERVFSTLENRDSMARTKKHSVTATAKSAGTSGLEARSRNPHLKSQVTLDGTITELRKRKTAKMKTLSEAASACTSAFTANLPNQNTNHQAVEEDPHEG